MKTHEKVICAVLMAVLASIVLSLSVALAAPPNHCPPGDNNSFAPCDPPKPEEKLYDTVCRFPDACLAARINVPGVARTNKLPNVQPAWYERVGTRMEYGRLGGR